MARLVVNPDTPEAWPIELQPGVLSLGRSEGNDVPIDHPSVSSSHCRITKNDSGTWLKDLGSTAGTFVNGELVEEVKLEPNQLIYLGEVALRFESDAPEDDAPLKALPLARQIDVTPAPATSSRCKFHPQTLARFHCPKCHLAFCDLCITTRVTRGAARKFCRRCGSECQPIQLQRQRDESRHSFTGSLPRALLYPFQGSGVMMLVAGTAFFFLLGWLPLLGLIVTGYLFNFAKSIITSTAEGRQDLPDWPDFSDWKDDILMPYLQLFALMLLCFGPAFIIALWQPGSENATRIAWFAALGFGGLLAPMGMLALAIFDRIAALNPIALTWSILRVPLPYLLAAASFEFVLLLHWFAKAVLESLVRVPLLPG